MQTIAQEAKVRLLFVDATLSKLIATNVWVISVGSDSFAHSVRCAGVGSWVGAQGGVGGGQGEQRIQIAAPIGGGRDLDACDGKCLDLFHKFGFQAHRAKTVDFAINIVVAID